AAEDDALGDLADLDAQRVRRLLRGARGVVQHPRRVGMARIAQRARHALHAFGEGCQFSSAHASRHPARLLRIAVAAREFGLRPRKSLMNLPASTSLSRSMPVSTPMPCSMNTTSSVATLPVAPFA